MWQSPKLFIWWWLSFHELNVAQWSYMLPKNLVNISSGGGLVPDGTKPLSESMLTWRPVAFTWRKLHRTCSKYINHLRGWIMFYFMYDPKCSMTFPWCTINAPVVFAWCATNAPAAFLLMYEPLCTLSGIFAHRVERSSPIVIMEALLKLHIQNYSISFKPITSNLKSCAATGEKLTAE